MLFTYQASSVDVTDITMWCQLSSAACGLGKLLLAKIALEQASGLAMSVLEELVVSSWFHWLTNRLSGAMIATGPLSTLCAP